MAPPPPPNFLFYRWEKGGRGRGKEKWVVEEAILPSAVYVFVCVGLLRKFDECVLAPPSSPLDAIPCLLERICLRDV